MAHIFGTESDNCHKHRTSPGPHNPDEVLGAHYRRLPHLFGQHEKAVVVDFAVSLSAILRFFIRTWLISSAPKVPMAANTGLRQAPMIQMKCPGHTIDDIRACLGHAEVVAVDFAVSLSAKVRLFISTWLTSSAPKVPIAANTGLRQVPIMQMKCPERTIDDFRTYLSYAEAVTVDFAVSL
jgi:hypothetical protein